MGEPIKVVFYRTIPLSAGAKEKAGIEVKGIGRCLKHDAILFGEGTAVPGEGGELQDLYATAKLVRSKGEGGLFEESGETEEELYNYEAVRKVNQIKGVSIWSTYRIRELRELLSAYIGCPTTHLILFTPDGPMPPPASVPTDCILPVTVLPDEVLVLVLGDWIKRAEVIHHWKELPKDRPTDLAPWIGAEVSSIRQEVLSAYSTRNRLLSKLKPRVGPMHGQVTRSTIHVRPDDPSKRGNGEEERGKGEKGKGEKGSKLSVISLTRLFHLLHLDREERGRLGQLTVMSYAGKTKALISTRFIPSTITETKSVAALRAILLVAVKDTPIHAYDVSIHPDFSISLSSTWAGEGALSKTEVAGRMTGATDCILHRIYGIIESNVMEPGYSFPPREDLASIISVASYQEEYTGGNFIALSTIISSLAHAKMMQITYLMTSSIYLQIAIGASRERVISTYQYLYAHLGIDKEGFASIWSNPEMAASFRHFLLKGPSLTFKSEGADLFILISGCSGEDEMLTASDLAARIAITAGYKPRETSVRESRDYANLHLLEQIDPILFGSRPLPGGERSNYSRECQNASRHPIPIALSSSISSAPSKAKRSKAEKGSKTEAKAKAKAKVKPEGEKKVDRSVAILQNLSYGGPQAYKCVHPDYPIFSMRPAIFTSYCTPCCTQEVSSELKEYEIEWCFSRMSFYPPPRSTVRSTRSAGSDRAERDGREETYWGDTAQRNKRVIGKPLQFNGQHIADGRLAWLPSGVRTSFKEEAYLFHPYGVDISSLRSVAEWVLDSSDLPAYESEDPVEAIGEYASRGYPLTIIRLIPSSIREWKGSLLQMGTLHDVPPYIIALVAKDSEGSEVLAYYPIITLISKNVASPITIDSLEIGRSRVEVRRDESIFSYSAIVDSSVPISGGVFTGGRCVGLTLIIGGVKGREVFIPIRSAKAKEIRVIDPTNLTFPSAKEVDLLISLIPSARKKSNLWCSLIVEIGSSGPGAKAERIAMRIEPDSVMLYLSDTKIPSAIHVDPEVKRIRVERSLEASLWSPIIPVELPPPSLSREILRIAEGYVAGKIVADPSFLSALVKGVSSGEDMRPLLRRFISKVAKIGIQTSLPLVGKSIILFGETLSITPQILDLIVERLGHGLPENHFLMEAYLRDFFAISPTDWGRLESWEKMIV